MTNEEFKKLQDWWSRFEKVHHNAHPNVDGNACRVCGDFVHVTEGDWVNGESICSSCSIHIAEDLFMWMPKILKALITKEQAAGVLAWLKKVEGAWSFHMLRTHGHAAGEVSRKEVGAFSEEQPDAKEGYERLGAISKNEGTS